MRGMALKPEAKSPSRSSSAKATLASFIGRITLLAAGVDFIYLLFFLAVGSPWLAWMNVVSVTMYLTAYSLVQRRKLRLAVGLIWLEAFPHALVGTLLTGWDSGFHYLLLMFIPAVAITGKRRHVYVLVALLMVFLAAMDTASRHWGPLAPLAPAALMALKWLNISIFAAMFASLALYYRNSIASAEKHLNALAMEDTLTGLYNRRHFQQVADADATRRLRTGTTTCVVLGDIDHFKHINDTHGHDRGDQVLVAFAQVLKATLRDVDTLARWGGEEFIVLMPDTRLDTAANVAERVRMKLETMGLTGDNVRCTMSFGVAELGPNDSPALGIARADQALYRAKGNGRNRVELWADAA